MEGTAFEDHNLNTACLQPPFSHPVPAQRKLARLIVGMIQELPPLALCSRLLETSKVLVSSSFLGSLLTGEGKQLKNPFFFRGSGVRVGNSLL